MADLKDYLAELKASTVGLGFQCHKDTYDAAIRALEKQIPKKAHGRECPSCSGDVSIYQVPYCQCCGQALDWGEDNA